MGKSRKPAARKPLAPKDSNIGHQVQAQPQSNDVAKQMRDVSRREAERRIAAIRAVCDAEIEGYLTQLRVALSMLSKEVRMMPLREFVSRFCPERQLIRAPYSNLIELRLNSSKLSVPDCLNVAESFEFHGHTIPSFLCQALSTPHGFPFTATTGKDVSVEITNKVVHDESEDEEFLKFMESFRSSKFFQSTAKSPAMSMLGVTPKTMRLPKKGETLLSINGSPLGVFEKDTIMSIPEECPRRARRRLGASAMLSDA